MDTKAVLVTGTIGTGKTTVATDLVELLRLRGLLAAAIDLDWLCWAYVDRTSQQELMVENLRAVMANFSNAGVDHYVLARLVGTAQQIDDLRALFGDFVVVRLVAPFEIAALRVQVRDAGAIRDQHLAEIRELDQVLDEIAVDDFQVVNDDRDIRNVSEELLEKLGWAT